MSETSAKVVPREQYVTISISVGSNAGVLEKEVEVWVNRIAIMQGNAHEVIADQCASAVRQAILKEGYGKLFDPDALL